MAKCDLYNADIMFDKFPALKKYLDKNVTEVGISNSGNIKYISNGEMKVVTPDALPDELYHKFYDFVMNNSPDEEFYTKNGTPYITMSDYEYMGFNTNIPYNPDRLYVYDDKIIYFAHVNTKRTQINKLTFRNKEVLETTINILKDVIEHPDKIFEYRQIMADWKRCVEIEKALWDDEFLKLSHGLVTLNIDVEWPCVVFKMPQLYRYCVAPCQNDAEIRKWLQETAAAIVEQYNEKVREARFSVVYEHALELIFRILQDTYNIRDDNTKKAKYDKKSITISGELRTKNGIVFSVKEKFTCNMSEKFVKKQESNGLFSYVVTNAGKKWCENTAKKICNIIANETYDINAKKSEGPVTAFVNCIEKEFSKYNGFRSDLYDGVKEVKEKLKIYYCIKSGMLSNNCVIGKSTYVGKVFSIKYSKEYRAAEQVSLLKRRQKAINYFQSFGMNVMYKSGQGLLNGCTEVQVDDGSISLTYIWETAPYTASLAEWKKQTKNNIRDIKNKIKDAQERREKELLNKLGNFAGNFIAMDAAEFVERNQRYITKTVVVHYLRGLAIKFSGSVEDTGKYGIYNMLSSDYIDGIVSRMTYSGLFTTKTLKGTYGKFDILKPSENVFLLIRGFRNSIQDDDLLAMAQNGNALCDCDAEHIFRKITEKNEHDLNEYITLLNLISSKGFVCKYYVRYVSAFKDAPDALKTYIKMKQQLTEDDFEKKVYKEILKK